MPRYLDPKADVVFKKIFGEHPLLLKSFLNAVLPLPQNRLIDSIEYLSSEQVPVIPAFKSTLVDVRCTDEQGRVFIVEMQIQWTTSFMQRMLFNASKAYVKQLTKGEDYHLLKPVYGLGLLNTEFDPNLNDWYHHYKMVNIEKPRAEIKDLQLVFVELPKFKAKSYAEKKLKVLWLRFLSELDDKTKEVPPELLAVPEIKKAVELSEEAAYTPGELASYEKYWDAVSIEKTLLWDSREEGITIGLEKGKLIGLEEGKLIGLEEGELKGELKTRIAFVRKLQSRGFSLDEIAALTELPINEIQKLLEYSPVS